MNKTTIFKSFALLAAMLLGGGNLAWADLEETTVLNCNFENSETLFSATKDPGGAARTTVSNAGTDDNHYVNFANGNNASNGNAIATYDFSSLISDATAVEVEFDAYLSKGSPNYHHIFTIGDASKRAHTSKSIDNTGAIFTFGMKRGKWNGNGSNVNYWSINNAYTTNSEDNFDKWLHVNVYVDLVAKKVSYTIKDETQTNTLYSEDEIDFLNSEAVACTQIDYNSCLNSGSGRVDNLVIKQYVDNSTTTAEYTINYKFGETTIVNVSGIGVVGTEVNAESSVWNEGKTQKYYATGTTNFTIADGTNEFDVALREAEVWTYYVKAFEGSTELMTISTNSIVEGESASYGYPQYIAVNGVLYKATAQSGNPWWGESYTMTENNAVRGFQYAKEGNESIVFCSEAEDIDGLTVVSGGNTDIRASNRKGAYATAETTITTLEPGIYRVFGACYGNASTTFTLKAGDATVFTVSTNGNPSHTTGDAFLITETTDLVMPAAGNGGSSPKIMDYIIVQKAGEYYESMSIVGDFSEGAWDATKGIEMTRDAENPYVWTAVVKDYTVYSSDMWFEYKAVANGNWDDYVLGNPNATNADKNQEYNFDYDGAGEGIYTLTFTVNTQAHSVELAIEKQPTATVYFVNTSDWASVKAWVWDANNDNYNYTGGTWPGADMTATGEQVDGHDVYAWSTYELNASPTNIIISNNGSGEERTGDQPFVNGATYKADGAVTSVTKTISAAGYATYYSSYALDFSSADGLTAYVAKKSGAVITFEKVTSVPANTGVLLKGAAGKYTITTTSSPAEVTSELVGVTADTSVDAGAFVLMNGEYGVGFYKTKNAFTVGANTAYLPASVAEGRSFIGFDNNTTTGIANVNLNDNNGQVYDLQGRKVAQPTKGLYILNGKKVMVK